MTPSVTNVNKLADGKTPFIFNSCTVYILIYNKNFTCIHTFVYSVLSCATISLRVREMTNCSWLWKIYLRLVFPSRAGVSCHQRVLIAIFSPPGGLSICQPSLKIGHPPEGTTSNYQKVKDILKVNLPQAPDPFLFFRWSRGTGGQLVIFPVGKSSDADRQWLAEDIASCSSLAWVVTI